MSDLSIQSILDFAIANHREGKFAEAEADYLRVLREEPQNTEALYLLGTLKLQLGRHEEAEKLIRGSIAVFEPDFGSHQNLGLTLIAMRRFEEAIGEFHRVLELKPDFADAAYNLGYCHFQLNQLAKAVEAYQQAIAINPKYAQAYNQLGLAFLAGNDREKAEAAFVAAFKTKPDMHEAFNNLGNILKDKGMNEQAIECYRKAIELAPFIPLYHGNLILLMLYSSNHSAAEIHRELQSWNARHAMPLSKRAKPLMVDRDPNRKLRIGFSSPDFRDHPISRFIVPLFENLDRNKFDIYAYSDHFKADSTTQAIHNLSDQWRETLAMSHDQFVDQVRNDRIDILFDLAAHTGCNRLPAFAMKPAPIQVSWLAYCGSTGLDLMDYRISDPYMDPPGMFDRFYSEKTELLPDCYWCYGAPESAPEPKYPESPAPVFGSFNSFVKINNNALELWSRILTQVPNSTLLMFSLEGAQRDMTLEIFRSKGVDPRRIRFFSTLPKFEYFALYNQVHVALDPFPFNGGTTTCDALYMGVPVVSKVSRDRAVGRAGLSLLSNVGLRDLAAESDEDYVKISVELSQNASRLRQLRESLREQLKKSPLMDAPQFGKNMGDILRRIWRVYALETPSANK